MATDGLPSVLCPAVTDGQHQWKPVNWAGEPGKGRQCTNCGESAHYLDVLATTKPVTAAAVRKRATRAKKVNRSVNGIPVPPPPLTPQPEPGRDLSSPDFCPECGLEVGNVRDHRQWHSEQEKQFSILHNEIQQLKMLLTKALEGTNYSMPAVVVDAREENEVYKRKYIDQDYYFKRRKVAEYHRGKVEEQKLRKVGDDYHYDKT